MSGNEGRLPKPHGARTARVDRALRVYRRLWAEGARPLSADRRAIWHGVLHALIARMSRQECAEYYAGVRRVP
jgi:hypothetical protein